MILAPGRLRDIKKGLAVDVFIIGHQRVILRLCLIFLNFKTCFDDCCFEEKHRGDKCNVKTYMLNANAIIYELLWHDS